MQYLVSTSGNVSVKENQTYIVTAKNKQEALEKASEKFSAQYDVVDAEIRISTPHLRTIWSLLSIVLLAIAVFLSILKWVNGHEAVSIRPDLRTGILAVLFYAVYLVRYKGLNNIFNSQWTDFLSAPLTVWVLSSLFKTFLFSKTIKVLGISRTIDSALLLVIGIAFSAFGMKIISVVTMGLTCAGALINIGTLNAAMGINGLIFIFCAIFGLLIKASIEPAFFSIFPVMVHYTGKVASVFKNDLSEAKKTIGEAKRRISRK